MFIVDTDDHMISELYLWVSFRSVYLIITILFGYFYRLLLKNTTKAKKVKYKETGKTL